MTDAATASRASAPRFEFIDTWPAIGDAEAERVRAFWKRENAIADEQQASARLPQVATIATTPDGEVAGVCTALLVVPPRLGQPVYYWRCFVGAAWRSSRLVDKLLRRSCAALDAHARTRDFPAIGVLLELENTRFGEKLRTATWWNLRFSYIGKSPRGLDLRVHYFRGARLKS
jgi:hypothetical protein